MRRLYAAWSAADYLQVFPTADGNGCSSGNKRGLLAVSDCRRLKIWKDFLPVSFAFENVLLLIASWGYMKNAPGYIMRNGRAIGYSYLKLTWCHLVNCGELTPVNLFLSYTNNDKSASCGYCWSVAMWRSSYGLLMDFSNDL